MCTEECAEAYLAELAGCEWALPEEEWTDEEIKMMRLENEQTPAPWRKRHTLTVEIVEDGVPGAFNQPEDHMRLIMQALGNYCLSVELKEEE